VAIETLGNVRWVLLFYLMSYCWELFPGLNRLFYLLIGSSVVAALYAVWQHFTGVNLLGDSTLQAVPIPNRVLFVPTSFFSTPELLGTLMAIALPFPAAAYLFTDHHDSKLMRWSCLLIFLLLLTVALWTYLPGVWISSLAAILSVILMSARRSLSLIAAVVVVTTGLMYFSYGSIDTMIDSVEASETVRADHQRAQINTQVETWQQNPWLGVGRSTFNATNYDPGTGNVYFQVLAQSGSLGLGFYFLFLLGFLLSTYRIYQEIPASHVWHRVFIAGALASQIAFHIAGLYWSTLSEDIAVNLFVMIIASVSYLTEHYSRGLVTDDHNL
jgi:hypothetical protein